jgi:MGT family glycosyltransferase
LLDQLQVAEAQLLATAQAFDFPADALPDHVKYVGPQMADPIWANAWKNPWPASDTRPLVTVSFSTTFQNHAACLQNVIDGLSTLPVRVLVTLGGSIKREALKPAANCVLVESAPHSVVMKEAAVVIAHGGHGTTMSGLMARKPMLIVPHGRDQNDNAVRITERGAGLCLMPPSNAADIRAAVSRLLNEPSFAAAAKRLGDACAAEADQSRVVELLEEVAAGELVGVG